MSLADSTTTGSSSNNGDDSERAARTGTGEGLALQVATPTTSAGGSLSPPSVRGEEEDIVSPLSAISPSNRFFDSSLVSPGTGGETSLSGRVSPLRSGKRRPTVGLVTLSPVAEAAVIESTNS